MECDDAELLLAARGLRTLTGIESTHLETHLSDCAACREVATGDDRSRWVVRVPEDALDDPDLLVLPTVDPIVFATEAELARGGMGRITRVRDRRLGRTVAIKEVLDPAMRARFEREVAITAQLQHPAIVPVYEAGEWPDGSAFYTMRLVSGGTLAEAIARTSSLEQRLLLLPHVLAMTDALAYAHSRGIVHRDLKPGNVLVGEFGETVVIDWGLAKELRKNIDDPALPAAAPNGLTMAGAVLGTPGFMAPEQATGIPVDERADVYALGAILYNVLAGVWPFVERSGGEILELHRLGRTPKLLPQLVPRAPADLVAIAERAMSPALADRYPTAREMAEELRRFEAGQLLRSREYSTGELIARWIRRHRAAVAIGALAVIAIVVIGAGALIRVTRSHDAEQATLVSLLQEQGRAQLLAGDLDQARAYLLDAAARGGDNVALRHMLAETERDSGLLVNTLPTQRGITANVAYARDGSIITLSDGEHPVATAWRDGAQIAQIACGDGLAWSRVTHDGRRAVMITPDGAVGVYDTATGAKLWRIHDDHGAASTIDPDPSLRYVATTYIPGDTSHGALVIRDLESGATLSTMEGASDEVAFTDDGELVASCTPDGLAVWATRTGTVVKTFPHCYGVFSFLGPDRIVMQTEAAVVEIHSLRDGPTVTLTGSRGFTHLAADARTEKIIIADTAGEVSLWSARGEHLGAAHANVTLFAFSPDGALVAGGGSDRHMHVWDASTLEEVAALAGPDEAADHTAEGLTWSPDGRFLATSRLADTHAYVYRRPRGHRLVEDVAMSSAVADTAVVTTQNRDITVRDPASGAVLRRIAVPVQPADSEPMQIDRAGARVLAVNVLFDGARILDLATGVTLWTRSSPQHFDYALSSDGRRVLETTRQDTPAVARVIDIASGKVLREVTAPGDILEAELSPDGGWFALIGNGYEGQLVEVATGAVRALPNPRHVRFDPSGARLLAFGVGATKILDVRTGAERVVMPELPVWTERAELSASGLRVAAWASDRTAHVYDALTGAKLMSVEGVAWGAIALTPDGARLATADEGGTIRIWDTASGVLLEVIRAPFASPALLAWTDGGARLFARGTNINSVALWDVRLTGSGRRD